MIGDEPSLLFALNGHPFGNCETRMEGRSSRNVHVSTSFRLERSEMEKSLTAVSDLQSVVNVISTKRQRSARRDLRQIPRLRYPPLGIDHLKNWFLSIIKENDNLNFITYNPI